MEKRKWKYIIGVAILALLSVFVLSGCKRKQDKEQENTGIEEGLQTEEEGEGGSDVFEEIFSTESEENKTDKGTTGVTEQKYPSSGGASKEDGVQDDNKNNSNENDSDAKDNDGKDESKEKEHITGEDEDKEEGWGPII